MSEPDWLGEVQGMVDFCTEDDQKYPDLAEAIDMATKGYPVSAEEFLKLNEFYQRRRDLSDSLAGLFIASVGILKKRRAQLAELEAALKEVEWGSPDHHGYRLCRACGAAEHWGHLDGCPVGDALAPDADLKTDERPPYA